MLDAQRRRAGLARAMGSGMFGTYVLALRLAKAQPISIGRRGEIAFPAGWYLYVGSALGPGGMPARLARHRRRLGPAKRPHWHIDYLRQRALWGGAWACAAGQRQECAWAAELRRLPGAEIVAPGFGASDCRCPAHLVWVPDPPADDWFDHVLGAQPVQPAEQEVADLLARLTTGGEEDREGAALALGEWGAAVSPWLVERLLRGDAGSRWWAARALAESGGAEAVEALSFTLVDTDPDVRACAALALGRLRAAAAAGDLAHCLTDRSVFVADIAADALSMIGEPAIEALTAVLADEAPRGRMLAVRALGRIGSRKAVAPLLALLEDPSYLVRYQAREALDALGVGMVYLAP